MDRRTFISNSIAAAGTLAGSGGLANNLSRDARPNILFIIVDEMRYPKVFPTGINSAGEFLAKYMPKTYKLWQRGVKFANHTISASACSPSRASLFTGLYSQQNWITQTIKDFPGARPEQPQLDPTFPTYGSLLKSAGYDTPYIGKWHLSIPREHIGLRAYGFDYLTYPDPTGSNLQGSYGDEANGYHNDAYIAKQAAQWLGGKKASDKPWCLTVGFINPHDKEFFPAGTEYETFANLFSSYPNLPQLLPYATEECATAVTGNALANPPAYGYDLPANWESASRLQSNKPATQTFARLFQQLAFGGASDDPSVTASNVVAYPTSNPPHGVGVMPYAYWTRALDSYTQIMQLVDANIGAVVDAMPREVAENTIVIFTSDHGDYASAHGFLSGKVGTCYDEVLRIPLIIVDPTGRFAGDVDTVRNQLTSAIDIAPLLVMLGSGYGGYSKKADFLGLYGSRYNMLPLLKSASAKGREYALFATDELVPGYLNYNKSPLHIVGLVTPGAKLGTYADWVPLTTKISPTTLQYEFYDYSTAGGVLELDNTPNAPRARAMLRFLLNYAIPNELQAPLPGAYGQAQAAARKKFLAYQEIIDNLPVTETALMVGY
jgi:arylsulfatase A-like enzyme